MSSYPVADRNIVGQAAIFTGNTGSDSSSAPSSVTPDLYPERRARLRLTLARARKWTTLLERGRVQNAADLAAREGLTRARVSQILRLLTLCPEVLDDLEAPNRKGPVPTEPQLRRLSSIQNPEAQLRRYKQLVSTIASAHRAKQSGKPLTGAGVHVRGFQLQFHRAQELMALWKSGQFASLRALAVHAGLTPERVGQLLALALLAPDVRAELDVPPDQLPPGIRAHDLRTLAQLHTPQEQRARLEALKRGSR